MALLDALKARVAARAADPAPAPPPGTKSALLARLQASAGLPASWVPPPDDGSPRKVQGSFELDRIANLPRRPADWPSTPDLSPIYVHTPGPCNGGCRICAAAALAGELVALQPVQSTALYEAEQQNGAACPIGVGWGKTLILLLLADAMAAPRPVIMVKPDLVDQLFREVKELYSRHFVVPELYLYDGKWENNAGVCVLPYSTLSSARHQDALEVLKPTHVFMDECHSLRHRTAARTKRAFRFFDEHPEVVQVHLSGSMMTSGTKDAVHLFHGALRGRSPLPNKYTDAASVGQALDVVKRPDDPTLDPGVLLDLFCDPLDVAKLPTYYQGMTYSELEKVRAARQELAREGFGRRMAETPGVIATSDDGAGMGLVVRPAGFMTCSAVEAAMDHVRKTWTTPGGEDLLEDGTAVARVLKQLASGFYYIWDWPTGVKDQEWVDVRREWNRCVAREVQRNRPGLDSMSLVFNACARGELDPETQNAWAAWCMVKDRPKPPTKPVWLSMNVMDQVHGRATLAQPAAGVIIWASQTAVLDELERRGLPVFRHAEDSAAIQAARPDDGKHRVIVAGIRAHGEGKNLQSYSENLVVNPPANGTALQQLLGRTHRRFQLADEVQFDFCLHTPELVRSFYAGVKDARYLQAQRSRQKILAARWENMPAEI